MATLAPSSSPSSPPFNRRRKSWARRVERCCCGSIAYFPLAFVYGLSTWAVWVQVSLAFRPEGSSAGKLVTIPTRPSEGHADRVGTGRAASVLDILLYGLAQSSYTTAVFADPGSTLNHISSKSSGYSSLPTDEPHQPVPQYYTSLTAKSTGKPRYCKKCQAVKPDRAHHCSTCNRCVLKMDHHCPWLATCVGLRNYKAFILFLIYTSLFCWVCFAITARWVWREILDETQMTEGARVINTILLAVLSGIIGLVLSGFTAWHIYLALSGQTTIESLEKTRYLSPLKKSMERQLQHGRHYVGNNMEEGQDASLKDQLKEIHANALPGVTRPEEGEDRSSAATPVHNTPSSYDSPASDSLRRNYASMEEDRERERYAVYLDEQDSEKLPHAFNLGWRRNLTHVFGENPLFWPLPICNTTGDGWNWEVSQKWLAAREEVARERIRREENERQWQGSNGWSQQDYSYGQSGAGRHYHAPSPAVRPHPPPRWSGEHDDSDGQYLTTSSGITHVPSAGRRSPMKADQLLGREPRTSLNRRADGPPMHMQKLDHRKGDETPDYDTSSDEEGRRSVGRNGPARQTDNWNDIPDDFLAASRAGNRSRSQGRRKGD